jgi:class 3 adenylate cyclase/predicted ATPase
VNFSHVLHAVIGLLVIEGRLSYRRLQAEFDLSDSQLEALRFELTEVKRLAVDQQGEILAWAGDGEAIAQPAPRPALAAQPASRLAEPAARLGATEISAPPLLEASPAVEPPGVTSVASDAERRPLTVMFCDLADSTALSAKLDPEDLQDVIRAYQERCTAIVREYEGFVAKYMGDGILVYFGYPKSLERNAERAVRSGLAIVEAMALLNAELGRAKGIEIAVRIGIATGLVMVGEIVGEGLAQERAVIGEAPNVAARLQGVAGRNGIVVGALTKEVAGDAFVYQELGAHALKGIAGRVKTFGVVGLRAERAEEADQAETESGAAPPTLIGRDEETGLLRRAWQSTKDEGRGQVVLISGEAGIGKSVLVDGLRAEVRREGLPRIAFRCSPYDTNSALYPVIEHLKRLLRWQPEDGVETRLMALEAMLGSTSQPLAEVVPLFASLLSLPLPEGRYPSLALSPQQQKQQTQDALIAWTLEEAERRPLLQVWEDLHWADPSTLELLGLLLEQVPTVPLLIVLTVRPDFLPPWPARSHMTPITLNRLERQHSEALVARLAGDKPLPADVVEHIVIKTDGVPLYVEELTKTILVSDILRETAERFELTGPLSSLAIPDTLQASLMARLDRLPQVREIAQLGSVLGREFAYEMISGLATVGETTLQEGLGQLVEAELLYQRGRPPRARYTFKHALVQDAAYQSLLRRTRQQYHRQVAELLESKFPEVVAAQPELLARHYTEAGRAGKAVIHWQRAGQRAIQRSANQEAVGHLSTALEMATALPDTSAGARQELALQLMLGPALVAAKGYAAPEVADTYVRARELCQRLGAGAELCLVLRGLEIYHLVRGAMPTARDFGEQLLHQAERQQDPALLIGARHALGQALFCLGDLAGARAQVEQGIALYDPEHHLFANWPGGHPGEQCYLYDAFTLWMLGHPEQAMQRGEEALTLVKGLSNPLSVASAFALVALVHVLRREPRAALQRAQAAMEIAGEQRNAFYLELGRVVRGWALAVQNQGQEGITELQDGAATFRDTGARLFLPCLLALQAETLGRAGRNDEGLAAASEALTLVNDTEQRCWEAELHRIKGNLSLGASPGDTQAETCYHRALEVARQQQAKSWELRAATSLARLWRDQGKPDDARELLAPVYDWFSEGFETADLKAAHELLNELAPLAIAEIAG